MSAQLDHRLSGVWRVVRTRSLHGQPRIGNSLFLFGDFLLIQERNGGSRIEYSVDRNAEPHRIDLIFETTFQLSPDSPIKRVRQKGIYRIEGNGLWLCLDYRLDDPDAQEYPTDWDLRGNPSLRLIELERTPVELNQVTAEMLPDLVGRFCHEPAVAPVPRDESLRREQAAEERISHLVAEIHKRDFQNEDLADAYHLEMSDADRIPFAVRWLTLEVENGGFDQYFSNGTGAIALDTIRVLRMIGAAQTAAILEQAFTVFPGGVPPRDDESRNEILSCMDLEKSELLSQLDEQFYSCTEDLDQLAVRWLSKSVRDRP